MEPASLDVSHRSSDGSSWRFTRRPSTTAMAPSVACSHPPVACVEVLGFQARGIAAPARLIHGCAGDRFGKRDEFATPLMLSPGTPGDAQTEGSLGQ